MSENQQPPIESEGLSIVEQARAMGFRVIVSHSPEESVANLKKRVEAGLTTSHRVDPIKHYVDTIDIQLGLVVKDIENGDTARAKDRLWSIQQTVEMLKIELAGDAVDFPPEDIPY